MSKNIEPILKALQSGQVSSVELTKHQKKSIVIYLLERGKSHHSEIANFVGLSPSRITQINKQRQKNYSYLIDELDVKVLSARHIKEAERAMTELKKKGDDKRAWDVHRELIEDLQKMGYIRREPDVVKISLEDQATNWERLFGINLMQPAQQEGKQLANINNN